MVAKCRNHILSDCSHASYFSHTLALPSVHCEHLASILPFRLLSRCDVDFFDCAIQYLLFHFRNAGVPGIHITKRLNGRIGLAFVLVPFALWTAGGSILTSRTTSLFAFQMQEWLLLIVFAISLPFVFAWSRHSSSDTKFAAYSYPVYLCHSLFAYSMMTLENWAAPATFVLSAGLSFILIQLIDKPIEAWRQRRVNSLAFHLISPTLENPTSEWERVLQRISSPLKGRTRRESHARGQSIT